MERVLVFLAAITPVLVVLVHGVIKARADWRAEPLWNAFLMGGVAAVALMGAHVAAQTVFGPAISQVAEGLGTGLAAAMAEALIAAAIPEETAKFLVLTLVAERHVDVRRKTDILPLAVAVSLGFAALENVGYVSQADDWMSVAAIRSLTAVPAHGIDGLIMGALVTFARVSPNHRRLRLATALGLPILVHAAYDFPLMAMKFGAGIELFVAWIVILLASGGLATSLSTRSIAAAEDHDQALVSPCRPANRPFAVIAGTVIVISGAPVGAGFIYTAQLPWPGLWGPILSSILPIMLGIDLLRWSWRNRTPV